MKLAQLLLYVLEVYKKVARQQTREQEGEREFRNEFELTGWDDAFGFGFGKENVIINRTYLSVGCK